MSEEKKPGFWEGLAKGFEKDSPPDSTKVRDAKIYLRNLDLVPEDRMNLATWLFGQSIKASLLSAIEDDSDIE